MNQATRSALADCLAERQALIPIMAAIAVPTAFSLTPLLGWPPLPLMGAWVLTQLWQRAWTARRLSRGELEVQAGRGAMFLAASSALLAAIGVYAVATAKPWAMVAGSCILASGLLFASATTGRSRLASLAILTPNLVGMAVLPILAWREGSNALQILSTASGMLLLAGAAHIVRQRAHRALEAEYDANASKSVFLATVSHEIRTPLNGVLGMAQAMAAGELSSAQRQRLETVSQSGETLLLLLNDLLDLAKIEAGRLELNEAPFDLKALCDSARGVFEALAAQKALGLELEVEAAAQGRYLGDAARIRQILFNLVSNAIKFSDRGRVRLTVGRQGQALVFSVSDQGVGISPENLSRLFGAYEQLGAATAQRYGGTGLGLSISRQLAVLMNGQITVDSRVGEGSTFHLRLALARLPDAPGKEEGARAARSSEALDRPLRLLAAEDNLVNQRVLRALLEPIGVDPVIVGDGALALEAWRAQDWDVILMDVQMPVMNGLSAARAIRAEEAERGRPATPIIALTADAMAHQIDACVQAGMGHFVAKPIRVEDLYETIERALASPTSSGQGAGPQDRPAALA
jgi:two-component system, sensor histidine kinase